VKRLGDLAEETATKVYAWSLLNNHAHLLLGSGPLGLPKFMRRLLTGYAVTYNLPIIGTGICFRTVISRSSVMRRYIFGTGSLHSFKSIEIPFGCESIGIGSISLVWACGFDGADEKFLARARLRTVLVWGKREGGSESLPKIHGRRCSTGRRPELVGGG